MEDLGTLGGPTSQALSVSKTGEVVGTSITAAGIEAVFLWTRERGMRSLGTPGGDPIALATSVNTLRRVVGLSLPGGNVDGVFLPFLWTPGRGMRRLPTLGGDRGQAQDLNELGQIVGTSWTAQNEIRATLWMPTAGPLAAAPTDEGGAPDPLAAERDPVVVGGGVEREENRPVTLDPETSRSRAFGRVSS